MDVRCRFGWHQYVQQVSERTSLGVSVYELPGVRLECTRCHHVKVVHLDPADERRHSLSKERGEHR